MCRPTSINAGLMDFITANISNSSIKINISISYLDNVVDSYFSSIFDTLWDKICYTTFDIVKKPEKKMFFSWCLSFMRAYYLNVRGRLEI